MLHIFRESFGRYVAVVILGLIAVTFIFFGIDFNVMQSNFAAKVNGEEIPLQEFDRELQSTQNQYQQLYRLELTDDLRRELRRSVIDRMVAREALLQQSNSAGYRVSDERLAASIRETPEFQIGGQFSMDVYNARLTQAGLTPTGYEALQRTNLNLIELQSGFLASSFLTPAEFRRYIELYNERREVAYALFSVTDFIDTVEVGDDEIAEHYSANSSRYMTPESVDLDYIDLDLASVAATVEIGDEELRELYETERDRFETAEERRVRHILIAVDDDDYEAAEAEAAQVLERLEAGEDFAALAEELSDDAGTRAQGGDLGWIGRGMLPGPFEDTLFSMEVGETAGPVETEFGYHIIRLDEIRSGDVPAFESVESDLLAEVSSDRAEGLFFDRANALADAAFEAYDELQSAADAVGLPLKRIEGFTRAGDPTLFPNGNPVITAAFNDEAIISGRNSQLLELSDDQVAVIRVTAHHPPEAEPLEDVADDIRQELARNKARNLARAAADVYLALLGGELDRGAELAETQGATWVGPHWVVRNDASDPPELRSTAFAQPGTWAGPGITQRVTLSEGDEAVLLLTAVEPGAPENIDTEERELRRSQLTEYQANVEVEAYARGVRDRATVRIPEEILDPQL